MRRISKASNRVRELNGVDVFFFFFFSFLSFLFLPLKQWNETIFAVFLEFSTMFVLWNSIFSSFLPSKNSKWWIYFRLWTDLSVRLMVRFEFCLVYEFLVNIISFRPFLYTYKCIYHCVLFCLSRRLLLIYSSIQFLLYFFLWNCNCMNFVFIFFLFFSFSSLGIVLHFDEYFYVRIQYADFLLECWITDWVRKQTQEIKTMNGLNGVSNGHSAVSTENAEVKEKSKSSSSSHHHKSSSKDKHRDKDRDHKSSKSSHHSSSNKYVSQFLLLFFYFKFRLKNEGKKMIFMRIEFLEINTIRQVAVERINTATKIVIIVHRINRRTKIVIRIESIRIKIVHVIKTKIKTKTRTSIKSIRRTRTITIHRAMAMAMTK